MFDLSHYSAQDGDQDPGHAVFCRLFQGDGWRTLAKTNPTLGLPVYQSARVY
jgi:hypothetical protein